jgi:hypothetical protein
VFFVTQHTIVLELKRSGYFVVSAKRGALFNFGNVFATVVRRFVIVFASGVHLQASAWAQFNAINVQIS